MAPSRCVVYGCKSRRDNRRISFFAIPKDYERRLKWLELINRPDLSVDTHHSTQYICSLHFDPAVISLVPQLKPEAIPTRMLPKPARMDPENDRGPAKEICIQTNDSFLMALRQTMASKSREESVQTAGTYQSQSRNNICKHKDRKDFEMNLEQN